MRTRVKFCGCTTIDDARLAVELGVDAVGVIFTPLSSRYVPLSEAVKIAQVVPAFVARVAVFVNPTFESVEQARRVGFVPQFSGEESATFCEQFGGPYIKVAHLAPPAVMQDAGLGFERYPNASWMFDTRVGDTRGGTGQTFDWTLIAPVTKQRRVMVSGGLTESNVGTCIELLRPYGVDVRSGIETNGVKDVAKMRAFIRAVKEADATT